MSFCRHEEIYRSDVGLGEAGNSNGCRRSPHSSAAMSFQSAIPRQVALQQSLPPLHRLGNDSQQPMLPYNDFAASGNSPLNSVSQPKGALHRTFSPLCLRQAIQELFVRAKTRGKVPSPLWFRVHRSNARSREGDFAFPIRRFLAPNNVYSRHTLISAEEIRKCQTKSGSKHLKTAEE
jgi:hypothetical protein